MKNLWEETLKDNYVISWLKDDKYNKKESITFATLNTKDKIFNFCNSEIGILYDIDFDSIIGASNKDGATVLEDISKENSHTIYKFDSYVVNSYNDSKILEPQELLNTTTYNEMILNSKKITPKAVVYLSDYVYEQALDLSKELGTDLIFYGDLNKRKSR